MRFLILRVLTHSELGMFHEYRRLRKEGSRQRAVNFDSVVVDRVFPAAKDSDNIHMVMRYVTDKGIGERPQWLKRQEKNWRLEGNCPKDKCYSFVESGSLFVMDVNAGVSPAVGSWAVFPKNHSVTETILSHGESRMLAKAAMIALYGDEGARTRRLLSECRPDLFGAKPGGPMPEPSPMQQAGRKKLPPHPGRLVSILAAAGHTLPSAVADIVDNAISADATTVDITFGRPDSGHGRWISIVDNGRGMALAQLEEAMRVGSQSDYDDNNLGKYGYGLKGASWSQADVVTVVSRTDGKQGNLLTWDKSDMGEWEPKSDALEPWEAEATRLPTHGTAVLWKNMRPPHALPSIKGLPPHAAEVRELERHLALVFHRFLEGRARGRKRIRISINGTAIEPNNPVGHPKATAYDVKNLRIPVGKKDAKVTVAPFLLPSEDEITTHHASEGPDSIRNALERIGLYGKRNETQGLFIYRHDRLIKWGGWHEMWLTSDEKTKLARLTVDFGRDLDESFRINISKQIVHLPPQLQEAIKKLAEGPRKDSKRKYGRKGRKAPPTNPAGPGRVPSGPAFPEGTGNGPAPGTPPPAPPMPVNVKTVNTDKFIWKVAKGIMGALDVQVSDLDPNLRALIKDIDTSPNAVANLAAFLKRLDSIDAQKALMSKKAGG